MVEKRRAVAVEVCFGGFKDDKKLAVDSKKSYPPNNGVTLVLFAQPLWCASPH